jgi:hypothetical protein
LLLQTFITLFTWFFGKFEEIEFRTPFTV